MEVGKVLVSVCVPSLNLRPFIDERIQTILNQTHTNIEILIYDSFSDDGTWERIQTYAKLDSRIKAKQIAKQGLYQGLNSVLQDAAGEWVYIATGDDTMERDCIEKLLGALRLTPSSKLIHCGLTVIDERGERLESQTWESRAAPSFMLRENLRAHLREAPHDGVCAMAFSGIYTSLTQLLIHRSVFDSVGYFPTQYGPFGDFAWSIRVGLLFDCVHVPEHLATWRRHPRQASSRERYHEARIRGELFEIVKEALAFARQTDIKLYNRLVGSGSATYLFGDHVRENVKMRVGLDLVRFLLRTIFANASFFFSFVRFGWPALKSTSGRFRMVENDLNRFGVKAVKELHDV